jgi:hypothetical protein
MKKNREKTEMVDKKLVDIAGMLLAENDAEIEGLIDDRDFWKELSASRLKENCRLWDKVRELRLGVADREEIMTKQREEIALREKRHKELVAIQKAMADDCTLRIHQLEDVINKLNTDKAWLTQESDESYRKVRELADLLAGAKMQNAALWVLSWLAIAGIGVTYYLMR